MKLLKTLLAAVCLSLTAATAHADALADIRAAGVLKVAVPQDFPPFGSVGLDLQPQGYDIDVARLLAKGLGVKVELVPVTSANRIPYLQTKKVDLVISSLGKNPEREKTIDFSIAYAPFFLAVFGPQDAKITSADALAGKTVGITRGSVEDLELTKIAPPTADLKRFEDNNTTISAYLSGQVGLIATGNVVIAAIAAKNPPRLPVEQFKLKNSPCFIGLNKNEPALQAKVDELIEAAKKDGSLDAIAKKWLKMPLPDLGA